MPQVTLSSSLSSGTRRYPDTNRVARIARHPRAVFDGRAQTRVALDAERWQEPDGLLVRLPERVRRAAAHRGHEPVERHVLGPVCLGLEIARRAASSAAHLSCGGSPILGR